MSVKFALWQRCVLAIAVCASPIGIVAQSDNNVPTFEVAAVRPEGSRLVAMKGGTLPGGRFEAVGTLRWLIAYANEIRIQRVEGEQAVLDQWFSISAKATEANDNARHRLMLRTLIAQRFSLRFRIEQRIESVGVLQRVSPERLGSALRRSPAGCSRFRIPDSLRTNADLPVPACEIGMINGQLIAHVERISDFANYLAMLAGTEVVDETELVGPFDFEVRFNPASLSTAIRATAATESLPSADEALRDALGLRLARQRRPVKTLVIERAEPPGDH